MWTGSLLSLLLHFVIIFFTLQIYVSITKKKKCIQHIEYKTNIEFHCIVMLDINIKLFYCHLCRIVLKINYFGIIII